MSISPPLVTGVDFVSVATRDLDAMRAFYGDVLGLPCSSVWGREDPVGAEFETGTVTIALLASERLGIPFQPTSHPIALRVDDVHAARAQRWRRAASSSSATRSTPACATWRTSATRTATS